MAPFARSGLALTKPNNPETKANIRQAATAHFVKGSRGTARRLARQVSPPSNLTNQGAASEKSRHRTRTRYLGQAILSGRSSENMGQNIKE